MHRATLVMSVALLLGVPPQGAAQASAPAPQPAAAALVAQGNGYLRQRQLDLAVEAFQQAIALDGAFADAHLGLGATYQSMGRPADAEAPLRAAVGYAPRNAAARLNLGITLASLRREGEAIAELREARNLDPLNARILTYMGGALNSLGRIEEALEAYMEARRLEPAIPELQHNAGLMLMRLGRFGEAVPIFEEALRLNPRYRNARYHLSHGYNRTGRFDDAFDSWTKFLEIAPDDREGLQGRAWNGLYAGRGGDGVAADARRLLQLAGWRDAVSPFMAIVASLASRQTGSDADARTVLDDAAANCDPQRWPFPVIRYLRGDLTETALLAAAATNDQRTEARAYLGMDLLLKGRAEDARTHFLWVREYGNRRYLEYPLAIAELRRMGER